MTIVTTRLVIQAEAGTSSRRFWSQTLSERIEDCSRECPMTGWFQSSRMIVALAFGTNFILRGTPLITVVSGLPRSGTSLMMQMLVAGGLPALTDGLRSADENNPRGYFEWQPAKLLK